MTAVIYTLLTILGVIMGSFINALAHRTAHGESIAKGRSKCQTCGHTLRAIDLVPILSYLALLGKCRYCKSRISPRYILIELLMGALLPICYFYFGFTVKFIISAALCCSLVAMSLVDLETLEIPNGFLQFNLIVSLVALFGSDITPLERLVGLFIISLPLYIIFTYSENLFGGGDIKLMFSVGIILGAYASVAAFLFGVILCGLVGILLMITKNYSKGDQMAFGPYLAMGIFLSLIFTQPILDFLMSIYL